MSHLFYQNAKKKHFLLYHLKDVLTKSLSLPLGFLLKNLGLYSQQSLYTSLILYCSKQFKSQLFTNR